MLSVDFLFVEVAHRKLNTSIALSFCTILAQLCSAGWLALKTRNREVWQFSLQSQAHLPHGYFKNIYYTYHVF